MPESKSRKKDDTYTPPPTKPAGPPRMQNWVAPTMVGLLVVGLAWVVLYYLTEAALPIEALGNWNLLIGLAFLGAGCMVATKWR